MAALGRFLRRLAHLLWPGAADSNLEREVAAHLAALEDRFVRDGRTPGAAYTAARRALGGVAQTEELHRDARSFPWLEDLRRDVRYAVRSLGRAPGFTVVVLLTLGVSIGAAAAMFSIVDAVLIRPLPFRNADRLVSVGMTNPSLPSTIAALSGNTGIPPSDADFFDLEHDSTVFTRLMMFESREFNVTGDGLTLLGAGTAVSGGFFDTLGVAAAMGRTLDPADTRQGSEPVAVISDRFWRTRLHGAPDVLSRALTLDGVRHRIVGVMPPDMRYPGPLDGDLDAKAPSDLWVAMRLTPAERADPDGWNASGTVGRLRDGVSLDQARAEIAALFVRYDRLHPVIGLHGWTSIVSSVTEHTTRGSRRPLLLLLGGVALLLLIACGNASNLFLARTLGRARELSVRGALGAGRGRLVRQLLTEGAIVGAGAGLVGLFVAAGAIRLVPFIDPGSVPRLDQTSIDWRVFAFGVAASLTAAMLFGLLPSLAITRDTAAAALRHGARTTASRRAARLRRALIVAQVSLALVLLTGAALLVRSYIDVLHLNRGFSSSTMSVSIVLPPGYGNESKRQQLYHDLLGKLRGAPGIDAVGAVNTLPLTRTGALSTLEIDGRPRPATAAMVDTRTIAGDYFAAMGTPLVSGRLLTDADAAAGSSAVVVNRAFERRYFPGENPLGARIRPATPDWKTIVGIVADVRHDNLEEPPPPQVYWASVQPADHFFLVMRAGLTASAMASTLRGLIHGLDPTLGIGNVQPMGDRVAAAMAPRRFQMSLLVAFAIVALGVAVIGLYGVMAYSVRQRTMEIGIRMSLGASRSSVLGLVLGQGLELTLLGVAIGLAGSFGATRLMQSMLYGVTPMDPIAVTVVCLLLVAAGVLASYLPARRATRVNPILALRSE